jgi:hypothetical protein
MVNDSQLECNQLQLHERLEEADRYIKQINTAGGGSYAPLALQQLLRQCMDTEMSFMRRNTDASYEELKKLLDSVKRVQQRQTGPMQALRLAFGVRGGNDAEDLDTRIAHCKCVARNSLRPRMHSDST